MEAGEGRHARPLLLPDTARTELHDRVVGCRIAPGCARPAPSVRLPARSPQRVSESVNPQCTFLFAIWPPAKLAPAIVKSMQIGAACWCVPEAYDATVRLPSNE